MFWSLIFWFSNKGFHKIFRYSKLSFAYFMLKDHHRSKNCRDLRGIVYVLIIFEQTDKDIL